VKRLLFLVVVLIVYGSLYPWQFQAWRSSENPLDVVLRSWPTHVDRYLLRDLVINLSLYFPLGLTAYLAIARRHSRYVAAGVALLAGAVLSTSMEILQVYVPGRVPSLMDIVSNTAGTAAGALAGLLFGSQIQRLLEKPARRLAPAAAILLGCWLTAETFPFFPALTHTKLHQALAALGNGMPLSPADVWANAAEWFAAGLAARVIFGRLRWWFPLAALGLSAARFVIASRVVTPDELAGVILAVILWQFVPERRKVRAGVWSMGAALLVRELAPFHFSGRAQSFSWIPFRATLDSEWQAAVAILARKAFDYGAMVWLLRKIGVGYWRAGMAVSAGLLVCELAQVYLPGRTPEITDPVLALLMVAALWRADR
jgi:VanZ family protein